jgi:hypothetical protein
VKSVAKVEIVQPREVFSHKQGTGTSIPLFRFVLQGSCFRESSFCQKSTEPDYFGCQLVQFRDARFKLLEM